MNLPRTAPPSSLVNLRDVATLLPPADRLLTPGVLWRSEAPQVDDDPPGATPWPPATAVDLREPAELRGLEHPLARLGTRIVDLPLAAVLAPAEQARLRAHELELAELYLRLLERADAWLPRLVHLVATAPAPILLHCAAGKDRTGVTVALLLRLAGVPDDAVLADYLATADVLEALVPRLGLVDEDGRPVPGRLIDVTEAGIRTVLERLGDDPVAFHRDHGVADDDIDRWRDRIRR